jgi:hypothetical protein
LQEGGLARLPGAEKNMDKRFGELPRQICAWPTILDIQENVPQILTEDLWEITALFLRKYMNREDAS